MKISFRGEIIHAQSYSGPYATNHFIVIMDLDGNMYGWSTQQGKYAYPHLYGGLDLTHINVKEAKVKSEKTMPNGKTFYTVERCKIE